MRHGDRIVTLPAPLLCAAVVAEVRERVAPGYHLVPVKHAPSGLCLAHFALWKDSLNPLLEREAVTLFQSLLAELGGC